MGPPLRLSRTQLHAQRAASWLPIWATRDASWYTSPRLDARARRARLRGSHDRLSSRASPIGSLHIGPHPSGGTLYCGARGGVSHRQPPTRQLARGARLWLTAPHTHVGRLLIHRLPCSGSHPWPSRSVRTCPLRPSDRYAPTALRSPCLPITSQTDPTNELVSR